MTQAEIIFYTLLLTVFILGLIGGSLGTSVYIIAVLNNSAKIARERFNKLMGAGSFTGPGEDQADNWKKAKREQSKDDDEWLRKHLGE